MPRLSHSNFATSRTESLREWDNKPNIFRVTKQSGLDLEKQPRPSGRGGAFFLTSLFIELIEADPSTTTGVGLGQIYYGSSLSLNFNNPTTDPRTPDIIVTPNVGVTYSGSTAKQAEHGGFSHDDTNVVLLLSFPTFKPKTVSTIVGTAQVAPTILKALGMNPTALSAVKVEGTPVLPAVQF